jgi:hypothetical protein
MPVNSRITALKADQSQADPKAVMDFLIDLFSQLGKSAVLPSSHSLGRFGIIN